MKNREKWNKDVLSELKEAEKMDLEVDEMEIASITVSGGFVTVLCC